MCCSSCLRVVKEAPLSDCPCKIENHTSTWLSQDALVLVGAEVVEDDVKLAVRKGCGDAVHEVEKLDTATAFRMRRDDLSGGDFQRRKQRRRAVPLVVVALAGQGPAVG